MIWIQVSFDSILGKELFLYILLWGSQAHHVFTSTLRQDGRKGRPRPPVPFDEDCEECRVDDCARQDGDEEEDDDDDDDDDDDC